jgi:hypothetical protein
MKYFIENAEINLKPREDWFYTFQETAESDKLFYDITYNLANENTIVFAELIGEGTAKLVRINFNTTKGKKTGEFSTDKPFSNIYFKVDKIRFYSDLEIEFKLSIYTR